MLPYQNSALPEEARVTDLVSRMTLEEKFAQMHMIVQIDKLLDGQPFSPERVKEPLRHGIGATYSPTFLEPSVINAFQDYLTQQTRLGIPMIVMGESLHGAMSRDATVFPQAIGLASTFNTDLITKMTERIGQEARALGITLTYAPNLDLAREPRWGRTEENYGEDPYLTATMGAAYIKALQAQGVASSPKHYVAHGSPEGGMNIAPVHCGERELRDTMLPPFAAAFQEAGAMGVMPAYSEWDGIPVHASKFLMSGLLRDELGFDGFSISDFGAVSMLTRTHRVAPDALTAGKLALAAGIDMEAPNIYGFGNELLEATRSDPELQRLVNLAVSRILRIKFRLGLFENPHALLDKLDQIHLPETVQLSRQVARESIVLLKNGQNLLPLDSKVKKVALVGPNAKLMQLGDYTHRDATERATGLLEALTDRLGQERVLYAPGCAIASGSEQARSEAAAKASQADVAIVALGDNSNYHGGIGWGDDEGGHVVTCGEGFDISSLSLPESQRQLLETVVATGTPVVLVMISGRPYDLVWANQHAAAILQAWYPGEQGGHAICDLLFGDANPSGRLPISFPKSAGHIPAFYNHKVSARGYYRKPGTPEKPGRDYVFSNSDPLYPFGFGLSYTTFETCDLDVTPAETVAGNPVIVSVTVRNTGSRAGQDVVMLYLTDCYRRITPVVRQLRGFRKVFLQPGEEARIQFTLSDRDLAFVNEQMKWEIEPGEFQVSVGSQNVSFWLKDGKILA